MATFPTYGELLLDGYSEIPESAVIRTDMETGPAKQTKVRSRQNVARPCTYLFSMADYASWKTWFRDDIARGADWFDWVDPFTGNTTQARMQNGDYTADPYNAGSDGLKIAVSFNLETWDS